MGSVFGPEPADMFAGGPMLGSVFGTISGPGGLMASALVQ